MTLDLAILGEDGRPEGEVRIGLEHHVRLMALARDEGLELLSRMSDYYRDADYELEELEPLGQELGKAIAGAQEELPTLIELLSEIESLIILAKKRCTGLAVISD